MLPDDAQRQQGEASEAVSNDAPGDAASVAVAEAGTADSPASGPTEMAPSVGKDDGVPPRLQQTVEITDVGPCKKHVKVIVDRAQIDQRMDEKISKLMLEERPAVRGFRPGKAPRKLVERMYRDQVAEEVKNEVLMASLEQLAEEQKLAPLSPPNLDPYALTLPSEGPFIYEFDVEVRPEFELPEYKGLKIRRPVHTFTPAEIEKEAKAFLERYGQIVPKEGPAGSEPVVELGDHISATVEVFAPDGKELAHLEAQVFKVQERLLLRPFGVVEDFGKLIGGRRAGDVIEAEIKPTDRFPLAKPGTRLRLKIQEVKTVRLPEPTPEFLASTIGVHSYQELLDIIQNLLQERLEQYQQQEARRQVLEQLLQSVRFDIPEDLLERQTRRLLQRRILELHQEGKSEQEIRAQLRQLRREAALTAHHELRSYFLLQKIAEVEKIEISDEDIDQEIQRLARTQGISYRKMKARVEKEDLTEAIANILLERKALEAVLRHAQFEDYEWHMTGVTEQLVTEEGETEQEASETAGQAADGGTSNPASASSAPSSQTSAG
ncbi:trigger factor [Thermogemmata fonticola]|uniref:Trigger factor n=1 Tax=Thermogemmata fonticola TaxID=2755323 RepID=A0A7V8VEM8_9BACT|nr:trigger factor [Thermogemmata fonticola]MBA2226592.1 trigger factor [Thermogemmata fonticola]